MSVHFSSDKQDWATPDDLYQKLNRIYAFDLDVAASKENARCERYFTSADNGLAQSWAGARVWCNPPYGRQIKEWVAKANAEAELAEFIVMLVPARTDTLWWHLALTRARVVYIKGRVTFKGARASAPFPSALLYWKC